MIFLIPPITPYYLYLPIDIDSQSVLSILLHCLLEVRLSCSLLSEVIVIDINIRLSLYTLPLLSFTSQ